MVTRSTGWLRRYFSMPPIKSPMSISAVSGRPYTACPAFSEVLPVAPSRWVQPVARATSMPRQMEWIHAEQENGMTMPVVPRMEMPPTIPSLPFRVFSAIFSPSRTEISTSKSASSPATSRMAVSIILRGTGLIAGSPGGRGNPGRVMVPTPFPALKVMPLPGFPRRTVLSISAPWVTSGSSPASLTTPALAKFSPFSSVARENAGLTPLGSSTSTG
ncbi:hypothetical protein D3C87_1413140 [compost metagenome]